jgi:hypothetical protein
MQYTLVAIFKNDPKVFLEFKRFLKIKENGEYEYPEAVDKMIEMFGNDLERPLYNFDINKKVVEYKYYLTEEEKQSMAKSYKIDANDFNFIAENLNDWCGDKGGVDQNGVYGLSTKNKNGKHDGWYIFNIIPTEDLINFLPKIERMPQAVLTPSCEWIESPEYFFVVDPDMSNYNIFLEWEKKLKEVLNKYSKDSLAVLINCHL